MTATAPASRQHGQAAADAAGAAVRLTDLSFAWHRRDRVILEIPELTVAAGERLFLFGPSGSGKTTLLSLLGGVTKARAGRVEIGGIDLGRLSGVQRDRFRADRLGILFQVFNLIPYLSPEQNVLLPCHFSVRRRRRALARHGSLATAAQVLLSHMGLDAEGVADRAVSRLSVGQQQRVAAARALIGEPDLVIADEPTSALDSDARETFLDLLFREADTAGATVVFVSHDLALAGRFDRALALRNINRAPLSG